MVTITSTEYCTAIDCPGHREVFDHPGMDLVLTDDMAMPLALVPSSLPPERGRS